MLKNNDTIQYTQSAVNLETLLGKFIFSSSGSDSKTPASTAPTNNDNDNKAPASAQPSTN